MITAKQAHENYVKWIKYSQVEKFVHSVLELVITDERIARKSVEETEMKVLFSEIFSKIFGTAEWDELPVYASWAMDGTILTKSLYGKQNFEILSDLERMYEVESEKSFICEAVKALIYELKVVRGFIVNLDLEEHLLTISWDLTSIKKTQ